MLYCLTSFIISFLILIIISKTPLEFSPGVLKVYLTLNVGVENLSIAFCTRSVGFIISEVKIFG